MQSKAPVTDAGTRPPRGPRDRLSALGPTALGDDELLAVFLGTGVQGRGALELARELLAKFSSLRGLMSADLAAF